MTTSLHNKAPDGKVEWKSNLNIYNPMQVLQKKKKHHLLNISLVIAIWVDIFITYIVLNPMAIFLCQFYPSDLANFVSNTIIYFIIHRVIIKWFGQIVTLPRCCWLLFLTRYFFIEQRFWWYLVSSSSSTEAFLALFSGF